MSSKRGSSTKKFSEKMLCNSCQYLMKPHRALQPILEAICPVCKKAEWIGFLPEEWERYVRPLIG